MRTRPFCFLTHFAKEWPPSVPSPSVVPASRILAVSSLSLHTQVTQERRHLTITDTSSLSCRLMHPHRSCTVAIACTRRDYRRQTRTCIQLSKKTRHNGVDDGLLSPLLPAPLSLLESFPSQLLIHKGKNMMKMDIIETHDRIIDSPSLTSATGESAEVVVQMKCHSCRITQLTAPLLLITQIYKTETTWT